LSLGDNSASSSTRSSGVYRASQPSTASSKAMLSPSPELFKLIDSSRKDKLTKCCVFGSFLSGSHGNAWVTVNQAIALLIKDYGDFTFRFSIVNESGQSIYTKLVNVDLNYVIEEK
jgi:hypothetical protein